MEESVCFEQQPPVKRRRVQQVDECSYISNRLTKIDIDVSNAVEFSSGNNQYYHIPGIIPVYLVIKIAETLTNPSNFVCIDVHDTYFRSLDGYKLYLIQNPSITTAMNVELCWHQS